MTLQKLGALFLGSSLALTQLPSLAQAWPMAEGDIKCSARDSVYIRTAIQPYPNLTRIIRVHAGAEVELRLTARALASHPERTGTCIPVFSRRP
jgi:hypothetical protein